MRPGYRAENEPLMSGQAPSAPSAPPVPGYEDPVKPSSSQRQGPYGEAPRYPPGGQWQAQGAYSQQPAAGYPAIYQYAPPPTVRGRVHDAYPQRPHEGHPQRAHEAHPQRPTVSCPYCGHTGAVAITREVGLCNWASAVLMALLGFIPCCIIPFCCTSCKDRVYRCHNCGAVLGRQSP